MLNIKPTVFLVGLVCIISAPAFAILNISLMDLEDYSDKKIREIVSQDRAELETLEKEIKRLKHRWDINPTNIFAERIRRERILEDMNNKANKYDNQINMLEDELALRKQVRKEEKDQKKRMKAAQKKQSEKLKKVKKQNKIIDIEEWDPETKAKLKALEEAQNQRKAELEEKLAEETKVKTRNSIIVGIALVILAGIAIMFIIKKFK